MESSLGDDIAVLYVMSEELSMGGLGNAHAWCVDLIRFCITSLITNSMPVLYSTGQLFHSANHSEQITDVPRCQIVLRGDLPCARKYRERDNYVHR